MKRKNLVLVIIHLLFLSMLTGCGLFNTSSDEVTIDSQVAEAVKTKNEEKPEKIESNTEKEELPSESSVDEKMPDTESDSLTDKEDIEEVEEKEEEKIEELAAEEPVVQSTSGTYYVTAPSLNVRSGDSTDYKALGFVTLNTAIEVTGVTANGWYEFSYNGDKGYVSGNYLSKEEQVTEKPEAKPVPVETEKKSPDQTASNKNVVDKMTSLGNSQQVILVTTKNSDTSTGQFQTYEKDGNGKWNPILQGTAYVGKTGMSANKREGDGKSPIGKFTLGTAFGYQGNPGTKLNFRHSTDEDVWVDDSNSKYYNTWQKNNNPDKDWNSAETMMHRLYNYGIVINYNTEQTPNRGSAIFLHVGNSYTLGCTAMSQSNLISIMKWLDPNKNPIIIQTPESGLANF